MYSQKKNWLQLAAAAAAQMAFEQQSAAAMQALQHQLLRGTLLYLYYLIFNYKLHVIRGVVYKSFF